MTDKTELVEVASYFRTILKSITHEWKKNTIHNFSMTHFKVLYTLNCEGQMKVSELADSIGLTPGAITGVSDKLLAEGYVDRVRAEDDRRVVYIELTEKGKGMLETVLESQKEMISTFFHSLPDEDIQHLKRIFGQMLAKIE